MSSSDLGIRGDAEGLCSDHLLFCDADRYCCPKIYLCLQGSCRLISAAGNLPRLSSALRYVAAGGHRQASVSRSRGSLQWHDSQPQYRAKWKVISHHYTSKCFCQNKCGTCWKVVYTHREDLTGQHRGQCRNSGPILTQTSRETGHQESLRFKVLSTSALT